jgi:hypothetical protein
MQGLHTPGKLSALKRFWAKGRVNLNRKERQRMKKMRQDV